MFWGTSGYVTANVLLRTGLPVPIAILAGTAAALVLALPTGYLSIRSAGIYFSMITLAFAQMVDFIARQADRYTGGGHRVPRIPPPPPGALQLRKPPPPYPFTPAVAPPGR